MSEWRDSADDEHEYDSDLGFYDAFEGWPEYAYENYPIYQMWLHA